MNQSYRVIIIVKEATALKVFIIIATLARARIVTKQSLRLLEFARVIRWLLIISIIKLGEVKFDEAAAVIIFTLDIIIELEPLYALI